MLRQLFRCRSMLIDKCRPVTSGQFLQLVRSAHRWEKYEKRRAGSNSKSGFSWGRYEVSLFGLSWLVTVKDLLGYKPVHEDNDPLKELVKKAWLLRRSRKYNEAVDVLHEALAFLGTRKDEMVRSRVYDELANTYYEMGKLEEAEKVFRNLIHRLLELHGKHEKDPEFIGISLKLADIFAQKGLLDNAESGFRHCVTKQLQVVEEHMKKFIVSRGAMVEEKFLVEAHGPAYTDPIALLGMCFESYAHFIINYRDEERLPEVEEYMDEALKIYGPNAAHTVTLLNNIGAACIIRNRFQLALKYLSLGVDRILNVDECASMIPGFYCNYAEALFHCGRREEALEYARRAVKLSRREDQRIQNYAREFLRHLEADVKKKDYKGWFNW